MNTKKYNWILYLITFTIVMTIVVQVYWNYKNYLLNKQRVTNEIQLSLDNALEEYYAELAKTDFLTIIETDGFLQSEDSADTPSNNFEFFSHSDLKILTKTNTAGKEKTDSILINITNDLNSKSEKQYDSVIGYTKFNEAGEGYTLKRPDSFKKVQVLKGKKAFDSLSIIKSLKPIFIAINRDSLEYKKIDSLVSNQLSQKRIKISYSLNHTKEDTLFHSTKTDEESHQYLFVNSKSTYLKPKEGFKLLYKDPFSEALKRSSVGILISLLLSAAVISSLFYLLKIIKHQKQLAEVKNDLISNITHEFKTPIATIGVALESIKNFKVLDDKEKTKQYLDMSGDQLSKLNVMVEKLLETATLDSESLNLSKEDINVTDLLQTIVDKHKMQASSKTISFSSSAENVLAKVDPFHFENAINNILDNAIKYGGNKISVGLNQNTSHFSISISDNGKALTKDLKEKIFEKFYRMPKGNTHDVKGFGIGLYYTRKIIEKHGGTVQLDLKGDLTTFKIVLPNGQ